MGRFRWIFVVLLLCTVALATAVPSADDPCTRFNEGDAVAHLIPLPAHGMRLIRNAGHSELPLQMVSNWMGRIAGDHEQTFAPERKASSTNSLQTLLCTFLI
jgi:hypothetical protein